MNHLQNLIIKIILENQKKSIGVTELSKKYKVQTSTIYSWFRELNIKPKKRGWRMIRDILKKKDRGYMLWVDKNNKLPDLNVVKPTREYNEPSVRVRQIVEETNNVDKGFISM